MRNDIKVLLVIFVLLFSLQGFSQTAEKSLHPLLDKYYPQIQNTDTGKAVTTQIKTVPLTKSAPALTTTTVPAVTTAPALTTTTVPAVTTAPADTTTTVRAVTTVPPVTTTTAITSTTIFYNDNTFPLNPCLPNP